MTHFLFIVCQKLCVEFLHKLVEECHPTVLDIKMAGKDYLIKFILRHLTSEGIENSADQGPVIFLKLYNELESKLKNVHSL